MVYALQNWRDLDGLAASLNMPDLRDLTLDRFCNWLWWTLIRNAETQQQVEKIRATLWRPPPGEEPKTGPWTPEAEMASFNSLRRSLGK